MKNTIKLSFLSILFATIGCGGGGSDNNSILIHGSLIQGAEAASHSAKVNPQLAHGANEPIGEVQVCALGNCSTTDSAGLWGFEVGEDFQGGNVLFSINGHGIAQNLVIDIPENASDVEIEMIRNEVVEIHSISADGVEVSHDHSVHGE